MARRQAVLVIANDSAFLRGLVSYFNSEGIGATGAAGGAEAIGLVQENRPALVLADIQLPDLTGGDLISSIHRISQRIPVLFFAGPDDNHDDLGLLQAGAAGIIPNPTGDLRTLVHIVRRELEHARVLDEIDQLRGQLASTELAHTEQLRLQDRLFQAEKATAVGRLASGISHDLNNILTVMSGFTQCLKAAVSHDTIAHDYAERIANAAVRVGEMTEQLSRFGHNQSSVYVSTDINRIVGEMAQLLSQTIDNRFTFHTAPNAEKPCVLADPNRLQLMLLNLAVSAGQAMPAGGDMTCETRNFRIEPAVSTRERTVLPAGEYVEVAIRDTGGTMDEAAARKMIDPLCGSKSIGYASQLGLSGVQQCIREHHGELSFRARTGEHRAIILRLPVAGAPASVEAAAATQPPPASGHILLADDEQMIRTFVEQSLTSMGYSVTTFPDGAAAVEYYTHHADAVDLVILDQTMLRLSGQAAFEKIRAINPAARVVLCTGMDDTDAARQFTETGGSGVLSKPFRLAELSSLVAQVIGATK